MPARKPSKTPKIKVPEAVKEIITANPDIYTGFNNRLLNLSELARFLQPHVSVRVGKEVRTSAILMGLSRLQRDLPKSMKREHERVVFPELRIHSDLRIETMEKTREAHQLVLQLYNKIQKNGGYITITEGMNEITAIFDQDYVKDLPPQGLGPRRLRSTNVSAICVKYPQKYLHIPGLIYLTLQPIALQGINVLEIASTATELIIYVADKDVELSFSALRARFRN